jgi:hypothetical protein
MRKPTLNFIINALMFFCLSAITGIGLLIKYTLISGQEQISKYGSNVKLSLFGLNRHEWGEIHLIIGFILIGLLTLHIILHWKAIKSVYKGLQHKKPAIKFISIVFFTICFLLIAIPFIVNFTPIKLTNQINIEKNHSHRNH